MIEIFHQFLNRVQQLQSSLDDSEAIDALIKIGFSNETSFSALGNSKQYLDCLISNKLNRKVNTYVNSVILLYGLFEQYVEGILIAYLEKLDFIIDCFCDMPEKIKKNHTNFSAQLLLNRDLDKYRDRCTEVDIIASLTSCLNDGHFNINALAFTDHKSNFRIESLNQFYEPVGISGLSKKITQEKIFRDFFKKKSPELQIDNRPDSVLFTDLDDLAWRRNVVAHGWPDETLSVDLLRERIEFIRLVGECIYNVLLQELLPFIVKHKSSALSDPIAVYNNSIICFHWELGEIAEGRKIIAVHPKGIHRLGKIDRIEVNHVQKSKVIAPPSADIACKVSLQAKQNYKYYLLNENILIE